MFQFFPGGVSAYSVSEGGESKNKTPEQQNFKKLQLFFWALDDKDADICENQFPFDFKNPSSVSVSQLEKLFEFLVVRPKIFKDTMYPESEILNLLEEIIENKLALEKKEEESETVPTFEEGLLLQKENPEKAAKIFHQAIEKKPYLAYRFNEIEENAMPKDIVFSPIFILNLRERDFLYEKFLLLIKCNPTLTEVLLNKEFDKEKKEKIDESLRLNQNTEFENYLASKGFKEKTRKKKERKNRNFSLLSNEEELKQITLLDATEEKEIKKEPKEQVFESLSKGMQCFNTGKFDEAISCFYKGVEVFGYEPFLIKYLLKAYVFPRKEEISIPSFDEIIQIKKDDFSQAEESFSEGTYGKVYDGKLKNSEEKVAVKEIRVNEKDENFVRIKNESLREISNLVALRDLKGIIPFVGYLTEEKKDEEGNKTYIYLLVFERMKCTLATFFEINSKANNKRKELTQEEIYALAMDVIFTVLDLHHKGMVHRDLKPENFVIKNNRAYLIDWATCISIKDAPKSKITGTTHYLAPELKMALDDKKELMGEINPVAVDVYGVGIILRALYKHLVLKLKSKLQDDDNGLLTQSKHPFFKTTVFRTLSDEPKERPLLDEVAKEVVIKNNFF